MTLRRATPADAPAVADLERRAAHAPWSLAAVAGALRSATTRAWLAGEPPLGHAVYTVVADEGELLTIAVAPEARRQGLGARLLQAVQDDWRRSGVSVGWLEVRADNAPAKALYAAAGWTPAGARRGYYADGADADVYRWGSA